MRVALISVILPRMILYCILCTVLISGNGAGRVARCYGFQFGLSTKISLTPCVKKKIWENFQVLSMSILQVHVNFKASVHTGTEKNDLWVCLWTSCTNCEKDRGQNWLPHPLILPQRLWWSLGPLILVSAQTIYPIALKRSGYFSFSKI